MSEKRQVTAVGAFIFDEHERLFLARFAEKFERRWSIPGGKIDFGELPDDALKREIKEETNIDIANPTYFAHGAFVVNNVHVVYLDFVGECPPGNAIQINDEFSEWVFFEPWQLDELDMIPKTREVAKQALRYRARQRWQTVLASHNLGLIRKSVSLQPYAPAWAKAYALIAKELQTRLPAGAGCTIEHIGSTSVPGLSAKPILDVLVTYDATGDFNEVQRAIEDLGFTYKGDAIARLHEQSEDSSRHFFALYDTHEQIDFVHVHAMPDGHPHRLRQLAFRDALRNQTEKRQAYEQLKLRLREESLTRHEYAVAKGEFVAALLNARQIPL